MGILLQLLTVDELAQLDNKQLTLLKAVVVDELRGPKVKAVLKERVKAVMPTIRAGAEGGKKKI